MNNHLTWDKEKEDTISYYTNSSTYTTVGTLGGFQWLHTKVYAQPVLCILPLNLDIWICILLQKLVLE